MSGPHPGDELGDDDLWSEADERRYQTRRARELGRLRRGRRRAAVFTAIVLLVAGTGVYAAGLVLGSWTWPPFSGDDAAATTDGAPCPAPTVTAADPATVRVKVLNSTGRDGLAGRVAAELQARGFAILRVANDPQDAVVPAAAEVRHGPADLLAARTVAAQVPGAVLVDDGRRSDVVDLSMGAGYGGSLAPPQEARTLATPVPAATQPRGCVPARPTSTTTPEEP